MSLKLNSSGGGSVTLQEPSTASNLTVTLPTTTGTAVIQNASNNLLMNSGYGSDAVAYGCRAWVNFNGAGTVAIRASGNVSSITDNGGTGDYTINFTTAMPDANYAVTSAGSGAFGVNANVGAWYTGVRTNGSSVPATKTTTAVRVYSAIVAGPAAGYDATENYFCIFR
jgi:hypothetical protein